jgi:hypothetical protein
MVAMLEGLDWRISDDCLKIEVTANTLYRADFCFIVWLRTSYFTVGMKNENQLKIHPPIKVPHLFKVVWYVYYFLGDREDVCSSRHPCRFLQNRYWEMFDWTDDLARSLIYLIHTLFKSRKRRRLIWIQFAHSFFKDELMLYAHQ